MTRSPKGRTVEAVAELCAHTPQLSRVLLPLPSRRAGAPRCLNVVMVDTGCLTSLREGGDEMFTFFTFPNTQWKALRSTNAFERLHDEFRRRVKTQGSLPSEDAALVLFFSLVASG